MLDLSYSSSFGPIRLFRSVNVLEALAERFHESRFASVLAVIFGALASVVDQFRRPLFGCSAFMSIGDVARHFGRSEITIRRWLRESEDGVGVFPKPITPRRKKALWTREQIESYDANQNAETPRPESAASRNRRLERVRDKLKNEFGITIKQANDAGRSGER